MGVLATKGKTREMPPIIGLVNALITTSMRTPFDNHRDTMNEGRKKAIHVQGVVCKFEFEVDRGSPYTGVFSPGTHAGLIRMGSATNPPIALPGIPKTFPGVAVKFLRNGVKSGNFVALAESGAAFRGDFFKEPLQNHVAPPGLLSAFQKFQQASKCMSMVGLSDLCMADTNGTQVDRSQVMFPFKVSLKPRAEASPYSATGDAVLGALSKIPSGTKLWDLHATPWPLYPSKKIGTFKTTSQCHTTLFGDDSLHFSHQRMEEDFILRPDWVPQVEADGCEATTTDPRNFMCGDRDIFPEESDWERS